jgi:uncharacterized protein DUF2795
MERVTESTNLNDVRPYLRDLRFPCLKHDAVHAVRRGGAPDEVVARVEEIPKSSFDSLDELVSLYREGGPETPFARPGGAPPGQPER